MSAVEGNVHLGMFVGVLMIVMMIIPMFCCQLSNEEYQKIMKRYEKLQKDREVTDKKTV